MLPNASRILAGFFVVGLAASQVQHGATAPPEWQIAAGDKMAFEVASVKPSPQGEFRPPNFPLDNGDSFVNLRTGEPPRGRFSATFPLLVYITFAYKIRPAPEQQRLMVAHLPKWVTTDNFDIEARAPKGNATKDQMRLMMQSLLAERFHLAAHFETQIVPAFALVLARAGRPGPELRPHEKGPPCDSTGGNQPQDKDVFPQVCETYAMVLQPNGMRRFGSRHTTMDLLAASIPTVGEVTRPVVDRTGLSGRFDFKLEWAHETNGAAPPAPVPNESQTTGPNFLEALNDQLGLKLEAVKAPVSMLVIDRVERPSEN